MQNNRLNGRDTTVGEPSCAQDVYKSFWAPRAKKLKIDSQMVDDGDADVVESPIGVWLTH